MKILVTGAKGFIGKNLVAQLRNIQEGKDKTYTLDPNFEILVCDIDTDDKLLDEYCKEATFIYNLAGINRPENESEFMEGNCDFASQLLNSLKKHKNTCPVMISSSTQAILDNVYGKSKKAGEDVIFQYAKETGAKVLVYRFPNVFGKWCKPNYNSAVATFCHNIAHGLDITVSDRSYQMTLVYIDDVLKELIHALEGKENRDGEFCAVPVTHPISLGEIVDLLYSFKSSRKDLSVAKMNDSFAKKLYSTYLSYLPTEEFSYPLKMNVDNRGSFTEMLRSEDRGQVSVNISKPGIVKGNHWHHTKNEKFLVVSGQGVIRFRKIDEEKIHEYFVSGDKLEVVDIPVGYTHNIENLGENDMVTVMWVNEPFDPDAPDTFYLEV
ncbi:capsular polysaccharide biosynthesis protein CapF [Marinifilum caeruleilacunae]|uniref:Capsular polysaccharide biosynthesis protein CapF n=1 Tax=Marinifilum caeruleilacunae TaxID=2499076 RepID=A0ABX1WT00_9BACT|nr:capsular polysaccharide biosynthesis protein CapF [Marinifilum caeruleilacunae]NOU59232.1 capsular polysaccharide biosynthesis protein CapF [Marinifilum caeruleilacunae]